MYANVEEIVTRAARPTVDAIKARTAAPTLRPVLAQIAGRFYEPGFTVAKLQRAVRATNRLFTAFRLGVGLTPWSFVQECRMETAVRLLRDTSIPVAQVAFLVGYEAFYPFQKLCLRWCGMNPALFRDHIRRVKPLLLELPEDVFSWHFLERCRRGELSAEEFRRLIRHIKRANGLA